MILKKLVTRNEAFEETATEVKTFWDMARIKTMEVKACKKKTHQFLGRMDISAEEQDTCGRRKAGEVQGEFR